MPPPPLKPKAPAKPASDLLKFLMDYRPNPEVLRTALGKDSNANGAR